MKHADKKNRLKPNIGLIIYRQQQPDGHIARMVNIVRITFGL